MITIQAIELTALTQLITTEMKISAKNVKMFNSSNKEIISK